jgi:hypothetical protein
MVSFQTRKSQSTLLVLLVKNFLKNLKSEKLLQNFLVNQQYVTIIGNLSIREIIINYVRSQNKPTDDLIDCFLSQWHKEQEKEKEAAELAKAEAAAKAKGKLKLYSISIIRVFLRT